MSLNPRLPDLTLAEAGRTFVMRPGSQRMLVLPTAGSAPQVTGPLSLTDEAPARTDWGGPLRRYRLTAQVAGRGVIIAGDASWTIVVRGPQQPAEQSRDDTDAGWGGGEDGHSQTWWEEQRPPHW